MEPLIDQRSPVDQLVAKDAIRDCLYRYCRGIDRADEAALRSAYWPDGTDTHGPYKGSATGFIDWAMKVLPHAERNIHQIHNVLIELKADGAAVESYFSAFQRQPDQTGKMHELSMKGRYIDWFVERDGEWRILNRIVVFDWVTEAPPPDGSEADRFGALTPIGANYPDDPSYTLF